LFDLASLTKIKAIFHSRAGNQPRILYLTKGVKKTRLQNETPNIHVVPIPLTGLTDLKLIFSLNCPNTYFTASLLRPCYDPGRSTVAMDAAGTQRGRSEEPKDAQGRRSSANILNMHKTVAETLHSC